MVKRPNKRTYSVMYFRIFGDLKDDNKSVMITLFSLHVILTLLKVRPQPENIQI